MTSELGSLVHDERARRGLSPQALAGALGYRNLNKGARRILWLEDSGQTDERLLADVTRVLGLDPAVVANTRRRDAEHRLEEFERWADEPQPMRLLMSIVPGVISELTLPAGGSEEEIIAGAVELAKAKRWRLCLVLDRRRSLWISPAGQTLLTHATPDRPNVPFTTIG